MKNAAVTIIFSSVVLAGCSGEQAPEQAPPRAVSYMSLTLSEPGAGSRLTGTVESWKREDIGFDVPGRVLRIVEPGMDIEGRTFDEEGQRISEGTVLAALDPERYLIAKKQAQTAADAARIDLEEVVPQMLAEAEAALDLADKELQRYTNLVRNESASQQRLDLAETAQKAAAAKVAQVEALRATKAALVNTSLATVEQAEVNIANCKVTSPFTGQIARVHILPGGYALPGQPVVTVQMMDPMKVQVAVSSEMDKRFNLNDLVRVYLADSDQPVEGYVYLKDTYADPATRTYLITLLVRNQKILLGMPDGVSEVPTTERLWKLDQAKVGQGGNYFIEVNAIHEDDDGHYVWKAENLSADQLYDNFEPLLKVKKSRIKLGDGRIPLLQLFTFLELTDIGDLNPDTDVILGAVSGEDVEDGGHVALIRERWKLRPGDLVQVDSKRNRSPSGFYVPETSIRFDGQRTSVFAIQDATDGSQRAVEVECTASDSFGELRRIEAVVPDELTEGTKIVVGGAPYVSDGEAINAVEEIEVTP